MLGIVVVDIKLFRSFTVRCITDDVRRLRQRDSCGVWCGLCRRHHSSLRTGPIRSILSWKIKKEYIHAYERSNERTSVTIRQVKIENTYKRESAKSEWQRASVIPSLSHHARYNACINVKQIDETEYGDGYWQRCQRLDLTPYARSDDENAEEQGNEVSRYRNASMACVCV